MTLALLISAGLLDRTVVPLLKMIFDPVNAWLAGLPDWAPRACAVALLVLPGLWAFTLKRRYVFLGAPDKAWWRDLRLWTAATLLPYVIIYLFLFRGTN